MKKMILTTGVLCFALLLTVCNAQDLSSLPTCATTCAAATKTSCSLFDPSCTCADQAYINAVTYCVRNTCSSSDHEKAAEYTKQVCDSVGISVTFPPLSATAAPTGVSSVGGAVASNTGPAAGAATGAVTGPGVSGATSSPETSAGASKGKSLSAGAAAGIGVGATLGLIAVAVGAFLVGRRRKQKGVETTKGSDSVEGAGAETHEVERGARESKGQVWQHVGEMDGGGVRRGEEIDGRGVDRSVVKGWGEHGEVHELK
ncbi:hypothetical protein EJ04DRAFT_586321 [Polyplosphaeria fusca]|uniref:CFEM domain-containing protein n=1 Tax=Polyplosphaeria fusca TaxID=682080 RepID=A0A9P4QT35_9PLEO|nr:hypothetical protein EJ04DRAFT_586321 [Polyplosphaeria fusca]